MAKPRKTTSKKQTKAALATEMRQRLLAKAFNDWAAKNAVLKPGHHTNRFVVAEPKLLPVLSEVKGFGTHAFVGGEELIISHMREDGTFVFRPAFVASFKEVHLSPDLALEALLEFMPFWADLEARLGEQVDADMQAFTKEAQVEQLTAAKQVNEEYGTW